MEWRDPVSDTALAIELAPHSLVDAPAAAPVVEEERPPSCPSCHRRLVILATHFIGDGNGGRKRRQLWGCPRGHATAYRLGGSFSPIELMPDVAS